MLSIKQHEFRKLSALIERLYGIHLKEEKLTMLNGRLQQLLLKYGFSSYTEYYKHVAADKTGRAALELAERISTNHTYFMREAEHFAFFKEVVLPYWENAVADFDLRVWCAGCATGEESYTLAMILEEYFADRSERWDKQVLATDISDQALMTAARGEYPVKDVAVLPSSWRLRFFVKRDTDTLAVTDRLRSEVIHRRFNLMDPVFPFKRKFHVIFCRNVMIYFNPSMRAALVRKFWEMMEPGGYFFVSQSESLPQGMSAFRYIKPGVYRKE